LSAVLTECSIVKGHYDAAAFADAPTYRFSYVQEVSILSRA